MTAATQTERHKLLRKRKRMVGLVRRTVWLDDLSLKRLALIKQTRQLSQDKAIAWALQIIDDAFKA